MYVANGNFISFSQNSCSDSIHLPQFALVVHTFGRVKLSILPGKKYSIFEHDGGFGLTNSKKWIAE
jgi:hypothetical protein